jgi:digeranylgeranylglycerophospholipid reductase
MAEHYDIIVVGGGPGGIAAAKAAAAEGGKVLLLEMQSQIGGQTQSATWAPAGVVSQNLREAVVNDVHRIKLNSPHQQLAVDGDFGAILDRRVLDKLLVADAVDLGAEIWVSSPVKELIVSKGTVKGVHAEAGAWSESIECEVVIDASGAQGQWSSLLLRKLFNRDWDREQLMLSSEYIMANASAREVELFFNSYFAPLGHAWVYPFDRRFAMVGIRGIRIHPDTALDEFIGRRSIRSLENAVPIAAFRGQLPIEGALIPTCADGILSVGGAAGLVYALSGEGLRHALACGELAGKISVDAITEGNVSKESLMEYDRSWRAKFEPELRIGQLLQSSLKTSPDQKMDSLLSSFAGDVKLQRAFINVFMCTELGESLRLLLSNGDVREVFGRGTAEKVLSLCKP